MTVNKVMLQIEMQSGGGGGGRGRGGAAPMIVEKSAASNRGAFPCCSKK